MPGTFDFVYDLLNKLESQDIHYHLVTIDSPKFKKQNIRIFTSLDMKQQSKILKYIEEKANISSKSIKKIDKKTDQ